MPSLLSLSRYCNVRAKLVLFKFSLDGERKSTWFIGKKTYEMLQKLSWRRERVVESVWKAGWVFGFLKKGMEKIGVSKKLRGEKSMNIWRKTKNEYLSRREMKIFGRFSLCYCIKLGDQHTNDVMRVGGKQNKIFILIFKRMKTENYVQNILTNKFSSFQSSYL